jgi:hypothetical protein
VTQDLQSATVASVRCSGAAALAPVEVLAVALGSRAAVQAASRAQPVEPDAVRRVAAKRVAAKAARVTADRAGPVRAARMRAKAATTKSPDRVARTKLAKAERLRPGVMALVRVEWVKLTAAQVLAAVGPVATVVRSARKTFRR